jgi:hypothetical protein
LQGLPSYKLKRIALKDSRLSEEALVLEGSIGKIFGQQLWFFSVIAPLA